MTGGAGLVDGFDNHDPARARVHSTCGRASCRNRIAPGTVLQEVPLAESLGVSRGPIREALGDLAAEGLVTITPRRGAVVSVAHASATSSRRTRSARRSSHWRCAAGRAGHDRGRASRRWSGPGADGRRRGDAATSWASSTPTSSSTTRGWMASGNGKLLDVYRRLIGPDGAPTVDRRHSCGAASTSPSRSIATSSTRRGRATRSAPAR